MFTRLCDRNTKIRGYHSLRLFILFINIYQSYTLKWNWRDPIRIVFYIEIISKPSERSCTLVDASIIREIRVTLFSTWHSLLTFKKFLACGSPIILSDSRVWPNNDHSLSWISNKMDTYTLRGRQISVIKSASR